MGKVIYPDFFPYLCQPPVGPFPWESNLNGYMKMYWRVKTWKVTATLTGYVNPNGSIISPGPGDYVFTYGWDVASEESLVCPTEFQKKSGPGKLDGWAESIFFFYWSCNQTYSPGFDLFFAAGDDSQDPDIASYEINSSQPVDIQIENFGSEISMIRLYTQTGSTYWGGISIKIRADEYWSYGGTYNTSTGEPL